MDTIYYHCAKRLQYGTVARSVDGGATFTPFEAGYVGSHTTRLLFTTDRRIFAATTDNGAYEVVTEDPGPVDLGSTVLTTQVRPQPLFANLQNAQSGGCSQTPDAGALPLWMLALSLLLLTLTRITRHRTMGKRKAERRERSSR